MASKSLLDPAVWGHVQMTLLCVVLQIQWNRAFWTYVNLNGHYLLGGWVLYLLVTLLRQASPKRGRMIHVLVPQHVLTLIPLDSAAEGRESARRGN